MAFNSSAVFPARYDFWVMAMCNNEWGKGRDLCRNKKAGGYSILIYDKRAQDLQVLRSLVCVVETVLIEFDAVVFYVGVLFEYADELVEKQIYFLVVFFGFGSGIDRLGVVFLGSYGKHIYAAVSGYGACQLSFGG